MSKKGVKIGLILLMLSVMVFVGGCGKKAASQTVSGQDIISQWYNQLSNDNWLKKQEVDREFPETIYVDDKEMEKEYI